MAGFDSEQQEILLAIANIIETIAQVLVHEAERRSRVQIAALRKILVDRGHATHEEIDAAVQEIEAGVAVEDALTPELQTAQEKLRRLIEQMKREQGGSGQK